KGPQGPRRPGGLMPQSLSRQRPPPVLARNLVDRHVGRTCLDPRQPTSQGRVRSEVEPTLRRAMNVGVKGDVRDRESVLHEVLARLESDVENAERVCALGPPSCELFGASRHDIGILASKPRAGDHAVYVRLFEAHPLEDTCASKRARWEERRALCDPDAPSG